MRNIDPRDYGKLDLIRHATRVIRANVNTTAGDGGTYRVLCARHARAIVRDIYIVGTLHQPCAVCGKEVV
jgi:hypothetical protein